jgi:uncharacterized protein DUF4157
MATNRTSANALGPALFAPARSGMLERKCDCGQHTGGGECQECKEKKSEEKSSKDPLLQRSALHRSSVKGVPPIVYEVLRSPGQPLDAATRAYFEPRFGRDFSRVRVHTNERARASASAVGAAAYAYGNNVVFARNQFSTSEAGRSVLAHELAHVSQAGGVAPSSGPEQVSSANDASEVEAESVARQVLGWAGQTSEESPVARTLTQTTNNKLSRLVGVSTTHCVPQKDGAPADPFNTLTSVEAHGQGLAQAASILFEAEAASVIMGITSSSAAGQAYQNRFGMPTAKGAGFLNRLTGEVKKTQNDAMQGELEGIAGRFGKISDNFGRTQTYRCIHGAVSLDGCDTHCTGRDASACQGVSTFFLCPGFWQIPDPSKATLLIHEGFHMAFGFPGHGVTGVGRNLRHAECYASSVSDIFNMPTGGPPCPSPPQ